MARYPSFSSGMYPRGWKISHRGKIRTALLFVLLAVFGFPSLAWAAPSVNEGENSQDEAGSRELAAGGWISTATYNTRDCSGNLVNNLLQFSQVGVCIKSDPYTTKFIEYTPSMRSATVKFYPAHSNCGTPPGSAVPQSQTVVSTNTASNCFQKQTTSTRTSFSPADISTQMMSLGRGLAMSPKGTCANSIAAASEFTFMPFPLRCTNKGTQSFTMTNLVCGQNGKAHTYTVTYYKSNNCMGGVASTAKASTPACNNSPSYTDLQATACL